MISFWHTQADHSSSRTLFLVNPPDIGLTAPASNFRLPARRLRVGRWNII
jgi:hypothetical protein